MKERKYESLPMSAATSRFGWKFIFLLCCVLSRLVGNPVEAMDGRVVSDFESELVQIRRIAFLLREASGASAWTADDSARLASLAERVQASVLLLDASMKDDAEIASQIGGGVASRLKEMVDRFHAVADLVEGFLKGLVSPESIGSVHSKNQLESTLGEILNRLETEPRSRDNFIYGTAPYRHLNLPSLLLTAAPPIVPVYESPTRDFLQADLGNSLTAEVDLEVSLLAESLEWNSTRICEWVKENVETEWYWGSIKGAQETLRQRSGNDCDQAALLVALLRASNYPARFVRGVIDFFPDLSVAQSLTGIGDPSRLPDFFRKAGILYRTMISGGTVSSIHIEHIWVETLVPFENFHGTVVDESRKRWVALDTAFKIEGYSQNDPVTVVDAVPPVITPLGDNPQILECPAPYVELGAALDDGDQSLGALFFEASGVDTTASDSYVVTYNISDASGNAAVEVIRAVNVVDTTSPLVTLVGGNPQVIECPSPYVELGATATDTCDRNLGLVQIDASSVDATTPVSYAVTCSAIA